MAWNVFLNKISNNCVFSVTVPVVLLLLPTILFQLISWPCWKNAEKTLKKEADTLWIFISRHKVTPKGRKRQRKEGHCELAKSTTQWWSQKSWTRCCWAAFDSHFKYKMWIYKVFLVVLLSSNLPISIAIAKKSQ